jgi:pimeloyl-ACP methyl ester carboxylesterase
MGRPPRRPPYGSAVGLRFAVEQPERLLSLTLVEPVAFHLLRAAPGESADHDLFREVAEMAVAVTKAVASGDDRGGMARFIDYWNGAGAWMRMRPELQAALARRTAKVALDFEATMTDPTPIEALQRIAVPTLVLRGSASPRPTRRIAELVAAPAAGLPDDKGRATCSPYPSEAVNALMSSTCSAVWPTGSARRPRTQSAREGRLKMIKSKNLRRSFCGATTDPIRR